MNTVEAPSEINETLNRMRRAWDAGDASAFAEEFTDDATYVIFAGIVSRGRDEIHTDHVPVLEKWQRGTRMSMRVLDVRVYGGDVAIVLTEGGIGKGTRIRHDKVQTYTLVRHGDRWRCAAFQNTKRNRVFAAINARAKRPSAT